MFLLRGTIVGVQSPQTATSVKGFVKSNWVEVEGGSIYEKKFVLYNMCTIPYCGINLLVKAILT